MLQKGWERHWGRYLEYDRTWAVEEDGRFVGNCAVLSRTVTLPGGPSGECPSVPFAAITAVGVHPTHRRRGLLRQMMQEMLDDARSRGECLAGLISSEASIYSRFGFAPATWAATYEIDTRETAFAKPAEPLEMRVLSPSEAVSVLPPLFESLRARSPGQVDRPPVFWEERLEERPDLARGDRADWYMGCDDGYAAWHIEKIGRDSFRLVLHDLVAGSPQTEASLWRFVFDVDLVREVSAYPRPLEEPLRHRLADPRRLLTTEVRDFLWLRVLDTRAALCARGYLCEGRLVLDVRAAGHDEAAGRWVLEVGPLGASCRRASAGEGTDLRMGVPEISTLLMGSTQASTLAAAGRIEEERPGALALADLVFRSYPMPFDQTGF